MLIYGWENPYSQIGEEIRQIQFEGKIIPTDILELYNNLDSKIDRHNDKVLEPIFIKLKEYNNFEVKKDWKYIQPNNLDEIKKERPSKPENLVMDLDTTTLLDRLHGAWTGRACGCALGKPVEIVGMQENGRANIKDHLQRRNSWPLENYIEGTPMNSDKKELICEQSWRENICYMEPDDDIHYTLIGLKVLEIYGKDFTWRNVADTWNNSLPYQAICTAENQAILNYNIRTHFLDRDSAIISPDFTSTNHNPYREWIGAQIRADGWAYCCAGNPELAAEFAFRDAHWTHRANGIYGEMFFAAVISAAFVESDPIKLINIGLSQIPKNCILAEDIKESLIWMKSQKTWEEFMLKLENKYSSMSSVHTINNALICCMSMYYSNMEPDLAISIAVMAGLDTDCNGATVGSIVGACHGVKGFSKYAGALNDTIKPLVFGFQETTMKELSKRTHKMWLEVNDK
ncbi:MAG: ADP-ribosylglycohydrolase family protein [Spirochaetaceae bacterium]